jgi:CRP-like cAMP-binding protein
MRLHHGLSGIQRSHDRRADRPFFDRRIHDFEGLAKIAGKDLRMRFRRKRAKEIAVSGEDTEGAPESPLFSDFSAEELAAVIGGLELIAYDPGDIIISQGEPGSSLFVLTSGVAKAFVRDERGRNTLARQMEEGSFFGEISILSGKPRTATVTAATRCELLELDRPRLDGITARHPRVLGVLRQFYEERIART